MRLIHKTLRGGAQGRACITRTVRLCCHGGAVLGNTARDPQPPQLRQRVNHGECMHPCSFCDTLLRRVRGVVAVASGSCHCCVCGRLGQTTIVTAARYTVTTASSSSSFSDFIAPETISIEEVSVCASFSESVSFVNHAEVQGSAVDEKDEHNSTHNAIPLSSSSPSSLATAHQEEGEPLSAGSSTSAQTDPAETYMRTLRQHQYWDVTTMDAFARSRITNYCRRMGNTSKDLFKVRQEPYEEEPMSSDHSSGTAKRRCFYVAMCTLPLPEPHRSYVAEGVGDTQKDAEILAAMHAERICDALGVPLFRLPSMQRKHAESVRAQGRYAPMPGDAVKPFGTLVPPPLRMLIRGGAHGSGNAHASAHLQSSGGSHGAAAGGTRDALEGSFGCTDNGGAYHIYSGRVNEAEIVEPSSSSSSARRLKAVECSGRETTSRSLEEKQAAATTAADATANVSASLSPPCGAKEGRTTGEETGHRGSSTEGRTAVVADMEKGDKEEWILRFRETLHYPWRTSNTPQTVISSSSSSSAPSHVAAAPTTMAAGTSSDSQEGGRMPFTHKKNKKFLAVNATFDPTEHGMWQMVNVISARCSPTPDDALVLPYVLERSAEERIKDHLLQYHHHHHSGQSSREGEQGGSEGSSGGVLLKDRVFYTHVAIPGFSTRMYVAELSLPSTPISARGKAATKELALTLACMHAELLLDALAIPLFAKDAERQARHAKAVAEYGRWAPNALSGNISHPDPQSPLPLPLKQQTGVEDAWLCPPLGGKGSFYRPRNSGERIVALHNELYSRCSDLIEVNPPREQLEEAVRTLREWQQHVAGNPSPGLFVITNMNEFFRATTLMPLPKHFGVRGGVAIGRSIEQAIQLCCLHAVEFLWAAGLPVYPDPLKQQRVLRARREAGLVTALDMQSTDGWVSGQFPCPSEGKEEEGEGDHAAAAGDSGSISGKHTLLLPYLPGFIIDGAQERLLPHIRDIIPICQLKMPQDFNVCGVGMSDAAFVEVGNVVRVCVRNYLQHWHATARERRKQQQQQQNGVPQAENEMTTDKDTATTTMTTATTTPQLDAALAVSVSPQRYQDLQEVGLYQPAVHVLGMGVKRGVQNIAYLRIPIPFTTSPQNSDSNEANTDHHHFPTAPPSADTSKGGSCDSSGEADDYVLAVGLALKKKDAERACYMHATQLLQHLGLDVVSRFRFGVSRNNTIHNFDVIRPLYRTVEELEAMPGAVKTKDTQSVQQEGGSGEEEEKCWTLANNSSSGGATPRPLLHVLLWDFLKSQRYYTPPRRRQVGSQSPF